MALGEVRTWPGLSTERDDLWFKMIESVGKVEDEEDADEGDLIRKKTIKMKGVAIRQH